MAFLDKKQDVINIKLTRFGKNLLARGFFKPVYYRFFDDGVVYDANRVGISETQNDSESRIFAAPVLEPQPVVLSVERSFDVQQDLIDDASRDRFIKVTKNQDPLERDILLKYPLHSYRGSTSDAPRFELRALSSPFTGSLSYLTSSHYDYNIPQIEMEVNYTYVLNPNPGTSNPNDTTSLLDEKIVFQDGTSISLVKKDLILDLEEASSLYGLDNFEVEFYEVKGPGSDDYILIEDPEKIFQYFDVESDESVKVGNSKRKSNRGFYLR